MTTTHTVGTLARLLRSTGGEAGTQSLAEMPRPASPAPPCYMLQLDDDLIACIIRALARVPRADGTVMRRNVMRSAMDVYALVASCRHVHEVYRTLCPKTRADKQASLRLRVTPTSFADEAEPYPFAVQKLKEQRTEQHYRVLRDAMRNMALHCGGACCRRQRAMVRSKQQGESGRRSVPSPSPAVWRGDEQASSTCTAAFARNAPRGRRRPAHSADMIRHEVMPLRQQICAARPTASPRSLKRDFAYGDHTHTLPIDTSSTSAPLFMASSPCGEAVAYIVAVHSNDLTSEEPLSRLHVWYPLLKQHVHIPVKEVLEFDAQAVVDRDSSAGGDVAAQTPLQLHPQHVAWRPNAHGRMTLVATWSTTFITPSGHCDEHETVVKKHERYVIAHYDIDAGGGEGSMEAEGLSRTPSRDLPPDQGRRAPRRVAAPGVAARPASARLCAPPRDGTRRRHDAPRRLKPRMAAQGMNWGPSAVSISPAGDAVLCVHRTTGSILVEVNELFEDESCEHSGQGRDELARHGPAPSATESTPLDYNQNYVKLPFSVTFSACGRFATVRPAAILRPFAENHAFVIFDLAKRHGSIRRVQWARWRTPRRACCSGLTRASAQPTRRDSVDRDRRDSDTRAYGHWR